MEGPRAPSYRHYWTVYVHTSLQKFPQGHVWDWYYIGPTQYMISVLLLRSYVFIYIFCQIFPKGHVWDWYLIGST